MAGRKLNATSTQTLLPPTTIGAAGTVVGLPVTGLGAMESVTLQATFLYGAAGTTCKAFVQTSIDAGLSWVDIACFAFTTAALKKVSSVRHHIAAAAAVIPGDATLADNTILDGVLGDRLQVKVVSTGTYTGITSIAVYAVTKG